MAVFTDSEQVGIREHGKIKDYMTALWKCDHCKRYDQDAEKLRQHEERCLLNPDCRNCYSCDNGRSNYIGFYCAVDVPDANQYKTRNCVQWRELQNARH